MVSVPAPPVFCAAVTASDTVTPPVAAVKLRVSILGPPPIVSFPSPETRASSPWSPCRMEEPVSADPGSRPPAADYCSRRRRRRLLCSVLHAGKGDIRVIVTVEADPAAPFTSWSPEEEPLTVTRSPEPSPSAALISGLGTPLPSGVRPGPRGPLKRSITAVSLPVFSLIRPCSCSTRWAHLRTERC